MEFSQDIKDSIKKNMLHITTVMKKKPRNYLNKQLQDAVCNYFLENYAAPFLKEEYQIISGRELRKKIEKSLPNQGKKYINLLNKFKSEIQRVNKGEEYRSMLSAMVCEEEKYHFESEEWCTLQRKKILALLLIIHWDEENILNFYDMWNSLFPSDPLIKQKLSKEEKEKQKKQIKNQMNNQIYNSIPELGNRNSISSNSDYYSIESPISLSSKRSSTSQISLQSENTFSVQIQPASVYIPQTFPQPNQKKVINNRIFEENEEDDEQFAIKIEHQLSKMRVCEAVEANYISSEESQQYQQYHQQLSQQQSLQEQQQQQQQQEQQQQQQEQQQINFQYYYQQPANSICYDSQNYLPSYYNILANNQYTQNQYLQQNQKNEHYSSQSLESNLSSEQSSSSPSSSSSFVNENITNSSQICREDCYGLKYETCSSFTQDDFSSQEDLHDNINESNSIFVPNCDFMNDNGHLIENTLFSFLNF